MISKNPEIAALQKILGRPLRTSRQKNRLNTSDCELLQIGRDLFAFNTDVLASEISWNLYRDPFLVGWMSVVITLSDIASSGARPEGLLLGTHWGRDWKAAQQKRFFAGVNAALRKHRTPLLGGDTSHGGETVISSTAIGSFPRRRQPLQRIGISPGDWIYADGDFGSGAALSWRVLMNLSSSAFPEKNFRPIVSFLQETDLIKASIDVSDGLANTFCILSELNQLSFDIEFPENFFNKKSRDFCRRQKLPLAALFFGEHGDYRLLLAVRPSKRKAFEKKYPHARAIARAVPSSKPSRLKDGLWKTLPLEKFFLADKSSATKLRAALREALKGF